MDLNYTPHGLAALQKDSGLTRRQFADLIGITEGQLNKALLPEESKSHRPLAQPVYEFTLLLLDRHPRYELRHRGGREIRARHMEDDR